MSKSPSPRRITVRAYTRWDTRKVRARFLVVGEPHVAAGGSLRVEIRHDESGKVYHRRTVRNLLGARTREETFLMGGVPSGRCRFRATFIDRHGTPFTTDLIQETSPGRVDWLGSDAGVTRKVPAPWTPLNTRRTKAGVSVECWGRTHEFDRRHFAKRIVSRGESLLARPVRVIARANGKELRFTTGRLKVSARGPAQVILDQTVSARNVQLTARTEVDYDGVVRVDWALSSTRPVRLDSLAVEIPVRAEHAKYLYHFPGKWGGSTNAGSLPRGGVTMGFHPYVWLGDEECGLAWFAESEENLFNERPDRMTEVRREANAMVLRVHLVSRAVNLVPEPHGGTTFTGRGNVTALPAPDAPVTSGLRYTFGLQATPVKPVDKDAWDRRIMCLGQRTPGMRPRLRFDPAMLDRIAAAGVRTVVVFEHWADAEAYVRTPLVKQLRKIVNDCHDRGLDVLLYFGFLASDITAEWRDFGKDALVLPKSGYPIFHYRPQPVQSAWRVCLRSPWQDLVADGMGKMLDEAGADGVYLDGTEYPCDCCNTEHGCGTIRPDGSIAPSYPIFSVRSLMRRIYDVVRSRRPDGQVNVHNSTCMTMPTLGYATTYWDGEQFHSRSAGEDVCEMLPLDTFRAEFMGRQWGVAPEFLLAGHAYTYDQACSFTLLHDVPVRPVWWEEGPQTMTSLETSLDLMSALWRVMDTFGRKQADWLPYWGNGEYVSVSPKGAYASLYRHPRNGVLAVISNLSGRRAKVNVSLKLKRLGLAGEGSEARDPLKQRVIPLRRGRMQIALPHLGWKLVWIR